MRTEMKDNLDGDYQPSSKLSNAAHERRGRHWVRIVSRSGALQEKGKRYKEGNRIEEAGTADRKVIRRKKLFSGEDRIKQKHRIRRPSKRMGFK